MYLQCIAVDVQVAGHIPRPAYLTERRYPSQPGAGTAQEALCSQDEQSSFPSQPGAGTAQRVTLFQRI